MSMGLTSQYLSPQLAKAILKGAKLPQGSLYCECYMNNPGLRACEKWSRFNSVFDYLCRQGHADLVLLRSDWLGPYGQMDSLIGPRHTEGSKQEVLIKNEGMFNLPAPQTATTQLLLSRIYFYGCDSLCFCLFSFVFVQRFKLANPHTHFLQTHSFQLCFFLSLFPSL